MKKLTARKRERLVREATAIMGRFGIDWSCYDAPEVLLDPDSIIASVRWRLRVTSTDRIAAFLVLSDIWWHEDTGEILQCGRHSGDLFF